MRSNSLVVLALLASGCSFLGTELVPYYPDVGGPEITGLDIESEQGNLGGGTVTISGTGFGSDTSGLVVLFSDKNAEIVAVSDTAITVVVPNGPVQAGKVPVTVAAEGGYFVYGDDEGEAGYTFDPGPTFEDDASAGSIYDNQNAYLVLSNFYDTYWASWVGWTGVDANAEFLEFAYPRYHTQDIGMAFAGDAASSEEWVVQVPAMADWIGGLEDLRVMVDNFQLINLQNAGYEEWVDAETLDPARAGDPNILTYDTSRLDVCEEAWQDERDRLHYSSEWPVEEDFFWTGTDDGSVEVTLSFEHSEADEDEGIEIGDPLDHPLVFSDGSASVDILLPPKMEVWGTEGFAGGGETAGDWTLTSAGVGTFDDCFDDDDDDDVDTTLDDVALRWEWEPLPEDFTIPVDGEEGPLVEVTTFVRFNITQLSLGWIGGEAYPIRTTLVVPDDHDYDSETGRSAVEMPMDVFYQLPTADVFVGGSGMMGTPTFDDPLDPRWGYTFVSAERITEYRYATDPDDGIGLTGDLVVAYVTGDFGLFSYDHPLDLGSCGDCLDNDGDGWVDSDDPDCDWQNRDDDSDEAEDDYTYGTYSCNDGADNDADGLIDAEDDDCESGGETESNCDDGLDNDEDGWIDELDGECIDGGAELAADDWSCTDGLDDDEDGWIDSADPDCTDGQQEELGFGDTACNDGEDNDGHGDIDALDVYCFYSSDGALEDLEEPEMSSYCADGEDNDADSFIDSNDPDCETGSYYAEYQTYMSTDYYDFIPVCYNGEDDDGDGFTDAEDPGCELDGEPDGYQADEED